MINTCLAIFALTINVVLINDTGLRIARIEIDDRRIESEHWEHDRLFIAVTPEKHHLLLVFRGGAKVNWPDFNFEGVNEVHFDRVKNKIEAHTE